MNEQEDDRLGDELLAELKEIREQREQLTDDLAAVEAAYEAKQRRRERRHERLAAVGDELVELARGQQRIERTLSFVAKAQRGNTTAKRNGHTPTESP